MAPTNMPRVCSAWISNKSRLLKLSAYKTDLPIECIHGQFFLNNIKRALPLSIHIYKYSVRGCPATDLIHQ